MAINFDLNDLLAFRAVAELANFRKAAEAVHISQPAFSRRIDKLEQALGVRLLNRTTRSVEVTAIGRDFERKVRLILDQLDTTLMGIRGERFTRVTEVTIACVPSAVNHFLSRVIARNRAQDANVRVKVIDASANEVLSAVSRGEADFGLNFIGALEGDIEFRTLIEEPFVAACRRDHPLATSRRVRWADLAGHDFIAVGKSSGNRLLLDQALAGVVNQPTSLCETQHVTTMLGLVEAGIGVAVVPQMAMPGPDHPLLVSVPLIDPEVTRKVGLIHRRGRPLTPAAQQLYDLCVELEGRTSDGLAQPAETKPKPAKKV
ncbi:MAG: LysR family transcriptional regulator [Burkholderiaceae bacterium]